MLAGPAGQGQPAVVPVQSRRGRICLHVARVGRRARPHKHACRVPRTRLPAEGLTGSHENENGNFRFLRIVFDNF
jgi:hypothetical protein